MPRNFFPFFPIFSHFFRIMDFNFNVLPRRSFHEKDRSLRGFHVFFLFSQIFSFFLAGFTFFFSFGQFPFEFLIAPKPKLRPKFKSNQNQTKAEMKPKLKYQSRGAGSHLLFAEFSNIFHNYCMSFRFFFFKFKTTNKKSGGISVSFQF